MGQDTVARDNLIEAILKLPNINAQDRRDLVVQSLGPIASHVSSSAEPRAHVVYIVDACLEYSGGLTSLATTLRLLYEGARALPPVLQLVAAMVQAAAPTAGRVQGPTLDEMLELLQMECNRHHNMERFGYIYGEQWKEQRNSPVVFLLSADEQECGGDFVLRLVRKSLQQLEAKFKCLDISGAPPPLAYQEMAFPDLPDESSYLDLKYLDFLVRERQDQLVEKYAHVGELFVQQYPWYATATTINSDRWQAGVSSVEAAITVVADVCIAHAMAYQKQKLFAFVLIQTRKDDPPLSSGEGRLDVASRVLAQRNIELHRLPPLDCVGRTDMEAWLDNWCKPVIPASDDREFLFDEVFQSDDTRCLPMKELRKRFRGAFKAWLDAGGNAIGV